MSTFSFRKAIPVWLLQFLFVGNGGPQLLGSSGVPVIVSAAWTSPIPSFKRSSTTAIWFSRRQSSSIVDSNSEIRDWRSFTTMRSSHFDEKDDTERSANNLQAPGRFRLMSTFLPTTGTRQLSRSTTRRPISQWSASRLLSTPTSNNEDSSPTSKKKVDIVLSNLTNAFPLFVLSFAIIGMICPNILQWVNQGSLISIMLASVMCGTGLTLEKQDFTGVVQSGNWISIPMGILCQYLIMPLTAFVVGRKMLLSIPQVGPTLFVGLLLVGCSPGGTASNLVSLIAGANVALSVLLTSVSTIMAAIVTPLLVQLLVGSTVSISGWTLCQATAKVVLLPVILGMLVKSRSPNVAKRISRFTPFASVLLVALICGGVVAQNAPLLQGNGVSTVTVLPRIVLSVLALHSIGFMLGYFVPKTILKDQQQQEDDDDSIEQTARTIAIETGMQNSALAVVLARSIGTVGPLACVPGALSATVHSCLGSLLAAYWRLVDDDKQRRKEEEAKKVIGERTYTGDIDFDPGMMI